RHRDMRRLQRVAAAWHRARLHRGEAIDAVLIGKGAAEAAEMRIERLVLRVLGMRVFAGGIGVPDFNNGVGQRRTVAVGDSALDHDLVALRLTAAGEVGPFRPQQSEMEKWTGGLGRGRDELGVHGDASTYIPTGVACRPRNTISKR